MRKWMALLLIGLGVAFLLENAGLVDIDVWALLLDAWPLIFVILGLSMTYHWVVATGWSRLLSPNVLGYIFLILLGSVWVTANFGYTTFSIGRVWGLFWPVLIIAVGLYIILNGAKGGRLVEGKGKVHRNLIGSFEIGGDMEYWELTPLNVRHKIGNVDVDLTRAKIVEGETPLSIDLKIGNVTLVVPEGLECAVAAYVQTGQLQVFEHESEGLARSYSLKTAGYDEASRRISVHIRVKFGHIHVQRGT